MARFGPNQIVWAGSHDACGVFEPRTGVIDAELDSRGKSVKVRPVRKELLIEIVLVVDPVSVGPRRAERVDSGKLFSEILLHLIELIRSVWAVRRPIAEDLRIDHPQRRLVRTVVSVLWRRREMPVDEFDVGCNETLYELIGEMSAEREGRFAFDTEQCHRVVSRFGSVEAAFVVTLDRVFEEL